MPAEVMLDPVCNVPVSGESRETKDWPPATFWKPIEERSIWLSKEVGHVYTLTQLLADQQTLRKGTKTLGDPCGTTEGLLAELH